MLSALAIASNIPLLDIVAPLIVLTFNVCFSITELIIPCALLKNCKSSYDEIIVISFTLLSKTVTVNLISPFLPFPTPSYVPSFKLEKSKVSLFSFVELFLLSSISFDLLL